VKDREDDASVSEPRTIGYLLGAAAFVTTGCDVPEAEKAASAPTHAVPTESAYTPDVQTVWDHRAYTGQRVVLNVCASWCGPCLNEIPHLERLAADGDVTVVGLSVEPYEDVVALANARRVPYRLIAAQAYPYSADQIPTLPTTFFLGPDGMVQGKESRPLTYQELRASVDMIR
jgi:thiol-disulfide isomerase/thioredoxin